MTILCEPVHTWGWWSYDRMLALTREHWIQIAVIVLTGVGMLGTSTWYLSGTINAVQVSQIQQNAALAQRVAADEARIDALSTDITHSYANNVAFQSEMRGVNNTMIQALADLKVQLAGKENMRQR